MKSRVPRSTIYNCMFLHFVALELNNLSHSFIHSSFNQLNKCCSVRAHARSNVDWEIICECIFNRNETKWTNLVRDASASEGKSSRKIIARRRQSFYSCHNSVRAARYPVQTDVSNAAHCNYIRCVRAPAKLIFVMSQPHTRTQIVIYCGIYELPQLPRNIIGD